MRRPDALTFIVFAVVVIAGGSNFVAVRFSNRELAPFWGAGVRFALAGLLLLAIAALVHVPLPRGRALLGAIAFGLLNFGASYALLYWALLEAPAALASAVVSLVPILTLFLAVATRIERFHWRGLLGGAIAIAGTLVLFSDQLRASVGPPTLAALFAAALCIAGATLLARVLPRAHPVGTNAVAMVPGALLLLALSALSREPMLAPIRSETWIALGYLVVSAIALFVGFIFVVRRWTASATSYATVLFPVVTVALAAALAGELVSGQFLLGTLLIMAGTFVGAVKGRSRS